MKTVHLLISGKVQGVFFRAQAKHVAERYNIKGWIKNTQDAKVEALITGETANVDEFIKWCKTGPEEAKVDNISISPMPETKFDKFQVSR